MISSQNLLEIKCHIVRQHLMDDPDELAGTVSKGIVVGPAFCHLLVVVILEGSIILNNVMSCIDQRVPKSAGAAPKPCS